MFRAFVAASSIKAVFTRAVNETASMYWPVVCGLFGATHAAVASRTAVANTHERSLCMVLSPRLLASTEPATCVPPTLSQQPRNGVSNRRRDDADTLTSTVQNLRAARRFAGSFDSRTKLMNPQMFGGGCCRNQDGSF